MRSFVFFTLPQISLRRSTQCEWGGQGMSLTWKREKHTRFWCKRDHSEEQGIDGIKMNLKEVGWCGVEWSQLAQDRDQWQALVNAVMNRWVLVPESYLKWI
jgi:hypothetical protein